MKRSLRLYIDSGVLVIAVRAYADIRTGEENDIRILLEEGLNKIAADSPYRIDGEELSVRVDIEWTERFSLTAVNFRVYDKTPVERRMYMPGVNVSRAYLGTRWFGVMKHTRFLFRFPDVFINLTGRDVSEPLQRRMTASVVAHEFGHVLGFWDKYRARDSKKRSRSIADDDIMYRTGINKKFQNYHIRRLYACAKRGLLPVIWI